MEDTVGNAVLAGRVGKASVEDRMDVAMGAVEREKEEVWGAGQQW